MIKVGTPLGHQLASFSGTDCTTLLQPEMVPIPALIPLSSLSYGHSAHKTATAQGASDSTPAAKTDSTHLSSQT
jgi:hypothetical protein